MIEVKQIVLVRDEGEGENLGLSRITSNLLDATAPFAGFMCRGAGNRSVSQAQRAVKVSKFIPLKGAADMDFVLKERIGEPVRLEGIRSQRMLIEFASVKAAKPTPKVVSSIVNGIVVGALLG